MVDDWWLKGEEERERRKEVRGVVWRVGCLSDFEGGKGRAGRREEEARGAGRLTAREGRGAVLREATEAKVWGKITEHGHALSKRVWL